VGYEVIDEQGPVASGLPPPAVPSVPAPAAGRVASPPPSPAEPYDLGELEPVDPAMLTPPGDEVSWRQRLRPDDLQRLARVPGIVAGAGLVLGALLGGYVVHQHAAGVTQARDRSNVSAVAVAENQLANGINGVRMATLTVRLTNFGPRVLVPVLSDPSHRPTQDDPLVEASTPTPQAEPGGGSTLVTITVPLPCDARLGALELPVRTVDRQVHQLEVRSLSSDVLEQDRTMCADPEPPQSFVTAALVGTPDRPLLRFHNQSTQARRVWLQSNLAGLVPMPGVTIRLSPSLPRDIDPQGTFYLRVDAHASRCIKDVGSYEQAQVWLGFVDTPIARHDPPTDSDWQNVMGSGIGSVVTTAMLRACDAL
jgi:hypothetical protein